MSFRYITVIILIFFSFSACRSDKSIKQKPQFIKVDCKTSKYRVQNLCDDEKKYLDEAAKIDAGLSFYDLNRNYLQKLTRETKDVDVAAALFYQRLLQDKKNNEFLNYIDSKEDVFKKKLPDYSSRGALFLIVPGMFYKDNPETEASGASLRELVRKVGMKEGIIEVNQTGEVDKNAEIICTYLKNFKSDDIKGIILVSASKGSGDIKRAIAQCGQEPYFKQVRGWINIGGITKGSLLVDSIKNNYINYLEARLYFLMKRYNWKGLMSMRNGNNAPLSAEVEIPADMLVVSSIGIPLFRHVTPRAKPYYVYLIRYGPSDGMVMLADAYVKGSYIYPSFRNDHYFQDALPEQRMLAILSYIIEKQF